MYIRFYTDSKNNLPPDTLKAIGKAFNRFTHGSTEQIKDILIRNHFPLPEITEADVVSIVRRSGTLTIGIYFPNGRRINTDILQNIADDMFSWCIQEVLPAEVHRYGLTVTVKEYVDNNKNIWKEAVKGAWHV